MLLSSAALAVTTPRSPPAALAVEVAGASSSQSPPNGLGVCVTGVMRTLLADPVVDGFDRYIRNVANSTDVHMVISVANMTDKDVLTQRIERSWNPDSLLLVQRHDFEKWQCDIMPSLDYPTRENGKWDLYRAAPQWFSMRVCYGQIEKAEKAREAPYRWLLRTRSDFVPLEPIPLETLAPTFAYMPRGGYAPDTRMMCQNDHLFLCPRHLCRGYFQLLEIWQSPQCTRNASYLHNVLKESDSIFASVGVGGQLSMNGAKAPTRPFLVPDIFMKTMSGHFMARYASQANQCVAGITPPSCCGLLREVVWPYTIARGTDEAGLLECKFTLVGAVRIADREEFPQYRKAMTACLVAHRAYSAELSTSQAEHSCNSMPDEFYEKSHDASARALSSPYENRRMWCRMAMGLALNGSTSTTTHDDDDDGSSDNYYDDLGTF
jgi:hypothetical protein